MGEVTVVTEPDGGEEGLALVTGAALATATIAQEQAQEAQQAASIGEAEIATALAEIRAGHQALAELFRLVQAQANTHGDTLEGILGLLEEWVTEAEAEPEEAPEVVPLTDETPASEPEAEKPEERDGVAEREAEEGEAEPPRKRPAHKHDGRRRPWGRRGR